MVMNKKVENLAKRIVSTFGTENVVCILLHGSVVFNPQLSQDVDLVIVLRRNSASYCAMLRRLIIQSRLSALPVQLHLFYLEEITTDADFCSINTCGSFIAWHMRQAKVLYGENVYDRMTGPSDYHLRLSLLQKFQQYTFQLRNTLCKVHPASDGELLQARKRTVVVLKDLLMVDGKLIQHEPDIVREALLRFSQFSLDEIAFLNKITLNWESPESKGNRLQFLQNCLTIHEHAYDIMRKLMTKSGKCKFMV
jgi:hypothetical protein